MKQKIMLWLLMAGSFCLTANAQLEKGKWVGSAALAGKNYKTEQTFQNAYSGEYVENSLSTSIIINKMISNKWMIGVGLSYNRNLNRRYSLQLNPASSSQGVTQTYGFIVQGGYFKEIAKNVYLSQILQLGINNFSYVDNGNYNYPNQTRGTQDGYEIISNASPLQCSYLFKKKFLLSLNLLQLNYKFNIRDVNTSFKSTLQELKFNLNPFQNGIVFSYIFN